MGGMGGSRKNLRNLASAEAGRELCPLFLCWCGGIKIFHFESGFLYNLVSFPSLKKENCVHPMREMQEENFLQCRAMPSLQVSDY